MRKFFSNTKVSLKKRKLHEKFHYNKLRYLNEKKIKLEYSTRQNHGKTVASINGSLGIILTHSTLAIKLVFFLAVMGLGAPLRGAT